MRVYTVHTREGDEPVLVPEGFSWGAAIFGPIWLLAHRVWIAGVLALGVTIAAGLLPQPEWRIVAALALAWVFGLWGQDFRRWSLARRGFVLCHVVSGRTGDAALGRLLDAYPDLAAAALR